MRPARPVRPARPARPARDRDTYSNAVFGDDVGTGQANCYAWSIEEYVNRSPSEGRKLQPGELAGMNSNVNLSSCAAMKQRILADAAARGNSMTASDPDATCPVGHYKIMSFIDKNNDFHFYRQHRDVLYRVPGPASVDDIAKKLGVPAKKIAATLRKKFEANDLVLVRDAGLWSHKRGFAPDGPILEDACGKVIRDPRRACRKYPGADYATFCGAYCFRKNDPRGN